MYRQLKIETTSLFILIVQSTRMSLTTKDIISKQFCDLVEETWDTKNWDWNSLSQNPNITLEFIEANPNFPWVWGCIAFNPNVTQEYIVRHRYEFSFTKGIARHPCLTEEFIVLHPELNWNEKELQYNSGLHMSYFIKRPNKTWNWDIIFRYCELDFDELRKMHCRYQIDKSNWIDISRNPNTTWADVSKHMDLPWSLMGLTQNKNFMNQTFIESNLDRSDEMDWSYIQRHCIITYDFINKIPSQYLEIAILTKNHGISPIIIARHSELSWDHGTKWENPNVFAESFLDKNPTNHHCWNELSLNTSTSPEFVRKNPNLSWNYKHLSSNTFCTRIKFDDFF